jgi:hypothetical protein
MVEGDTSANRLAIVLERSSISMDEAHLVDTVRTAWDVDLLIAGPDALEDVRRSSLFFRFLLAIEIFLTGLVISRVRNCRRSIPAEVRPLSEAGADSFDLVLNLTRGAIRSSSLPPSKRGVLRLHYGDIETGREGPPGFWELCLGRNASGWWLMLEEETAPPACVFYGRYKTKRLMGLNDESVRREAHVDLGMELLRLAQGGTIRHFERDFKPEWMAPGIVDVARCRLKVLGRETAFFLRTKARGKQPVFSIGAVRGHWQRADFSKARIIPNPSGSYLADPFLVEHAGQRVCFVEEFDFAADRGRISWLDLTDGKATYMGTLIEEPHHMSFPFVFEFKGEWYMVPETHEAAEIGLYRCTTFPHEWEKCGTLMEGIEASDTMVFAQAGRWWMLTNVRPPGANDFYSRLHLFWSNDPTGKQWTPHPLNPVLVDADGGRNGGILQDKEGSLYRVGQIQSILTYGAGWCINRIDVLSPEAYMETRISASAPPASNRVIGGHHLHAAGDNTVFDILHLE